MTLVNLIMAANPFVLLGIAIFATIVLVGILIFFWDELMTLLVRSPGRLKLLLIFFSDLNEAVSFMRDSLDDLKDSLDETLGAISDFVAGFLTIPRIVLGKFINFSPTRSLPKFSGLFPTFPTQIEIQRQLARESQVISPSERTARSIQENSTTNTTEVTLRTEPGTEAEVTKGKLGGGLKLQPSGGF